MRQFLWGLSVLALSATTAAATETITYTYDANGHLVSSVHSGTVNSGQATTYTTDAADNRTNISVAIGLPSAYNYTANYIKTTPANATYRPTISFTPASIGDVNFTSIASTTNGANGTVTVTVSSGTITYTYKATGNTIVTTDTFTYTLANAAGQTSTGTVTVNIDVETVRH